MSEGFYRYQARAAAAKARVAALERGEKYEDPRAKDAREIPLWAEGDAWRVVVLEELMARDNGCRCYLCGKELTKWEVEIEHIIPASLGGAQRLYNLAISCNPCNLSKGTDIVAFDVAVRRAWFTLSYAPPGFASRRHG